MQVLAPRPKGAEMEPLDEPIGLFNKGDKVVCTSMKDIDYECFLKLGWVYEVLESTLNRWGNIEVKCLTTGTKGFAFGWRFTLVADDKSEPAEIISVY